VDRDGVLLSSTVSYPIFANLSDIHGRKPFFLLGGVVRADLGAMRRSGKINFISTAWGS
jgi:MFS family permease